MERADLSWKIGADTIQAVAGIIVDTLSDSREQNSMSREEINALARILAYEVSSGSNGGGYGYVVDFLWMAFRIELSQKWLLLDLKDNQEVKAVIKKH